VFACVMALALHRDRWERTHENELKLKKHARWEQLAEDGGGPSWQRRWLRRFRVGFQTHHTWGSVLCRRAGTSFRSVDRTLVKLVSLLSVMSIAAHFHGHQTVFARGLVVLCSVLGGLVPNLVLSHLFKNTGHIGFFEKWQLDKGLVRPSYFRCLRYRFPEPWRWVWIAVSLGSAVAMIVYILTISLLFDQNPAYYCEGHTTGAWVVDFIISYIISVFVVEPLKIITILLRGQLQAHITLAQTKESRKSVELGGETAETT